MSTTRLPREHELQLLHKLSTDDDYRAQFASDPVQSLRDIGVSDEHLASAGLSTLQPGELADKSTIAATHAQLDAGAVTDTCCMVFPFLRLDYGTGGGSAD
ncbi:NHLP-related RiPP peptide [Dokdonella sp. MW10]|uniref:NHLP-related RiPP peptide n=1 Tax=Dokdonella sp. MW10 TaxID=2992926 RepID=UPI003F7FE707